MKPLSRRSVTTGLAAVVTAIPVVGSSVALGDAREWIKHHTRELERAMRDYYGVEVETLSYEPTETMRPIIFIAAKVI